jgi:membrane-bound serine protease (ClpP class)
LLILVGMALMVAEVFVTSFGLLFAGGILCFILGGSMLFDMPEVSDLTVSFWSVLVPAVAGFAVCAAFILYAVSRSFLREQMSGVSELVGLVGETSTALSPEGKVFVRGEYWTAEADEEISIGERVEVTAVDGMRLRVRRSSSQN